MAGSIYTVDQAASKIVVGCCVVNDNDVHPLVVQPTPCKRVWVGSAPGNPGDSFIGSGSLANRLLAATNTAGFYIHIDDAAKIAVQGLGSSSQVQYWIEQ